MLRKALIAIGLAIATFFAPQAHAAMVETPETWRPQMGDILYVNRKSNTAYLMHGDKTDSSYLPFLVATGTKRTVYYIGKKYFAATPLGTWVAKDMKIQSDRVTFGPTGRFFRLYKNGYQYTNYGIHSYRDADKWMQEDDRYKSMGCIVVSDQILDVIQNTYAVNNGQFVVITSDDDLQFTQELTMREQSMFQ